MSKICRQCGNEMADEARFCPSCGWKYEETAQNEESAGKAATDANEAGRQGSPESADVSLAGSDEGREEKLSKEQDLQEGGKKDTGDAAPQEVTQSEDVPVKENVQEVPGSIDNHAQDGPVSNVEEAPIKEHNDGANGVNTEQRVPVQDNPMQGSTGNNGNQGNMGDQGDKSKILMEDNTSKPKKKVGKKVIIPICIVAVILVALIIYLLIPKTETFNLDDYMTYTLEGYNGEGTCRVSLDYEKLAEDAYPAMESHLEEHLDDFLDEELDDDEDEEFLEDLLDEEDKKDIAELFLEEYVAAVADPGMMLSNGDSVTISYEYDNEFLKEYGIKLTGDGETFEVGDLSDIIVIDAFDPEYFNIDDENGEGIYIKYSGVSPQIQVQVINNMPQDSPLHNVHYEAYPYGDSMYIKEGDTFMVEASLGDGMQGYELKETVIDVTCENVAKYLDSLEDISDDTWEQIKEQCLDIKTAHLDQEDIWLRTGGSGDDKGISEYNGFEFEKAYLLSKKDGVSGWGHNTLVVQYSINVTKGYTAWSTSDIDYKNAKGAFIIDDIQLNADGTIEDISAIDYTYTDVYVDEAGLKDAEINRYADDYNITEMELDWD